MSVTRSVTMIGRDPFVSSVDEDVMLPLSSRTYVVDPAMGVFALRTMFCGTIL